MFAVDGKSSNPQGTFAFTQLTNLCIGIVSWYLFGYAFSYGRSEDSRGRNRFIGV